MEAGILSAKVIQIVHLYQVHAPFKVNTLKYIKYLSFAHPCSLQIIQARIQCVTV